MDLIERQAAIKTLEKGLPSEPLKSKYTEGITVGFGLAITWIEQLPSAQLEVRPIDYQDCSNAMLKMWMDNVVTDGEYNRIMDKLNAHWRKEHEGSD